MAILDLGSQKCFSLLTLLDKSPISLIASSKTFEPRESKEPARKERTESFVGIAKVRMWSACASGLMLWGKYGDKILGACTL